VGSDQPAYLFARTCLSAEDDIISWVCTLYTITVIMFCGEDEFFDGVVGLCSKCSDICAVVNDFCTINCPGTRSPVSLFVIGT